MGGKTMNDDFLFRLREPPRREFAEALYKRLSQPNPTPFSLVTLKRCALALACLLLAFGALLAISPDVRAQVGEVIRRIGVYSFRETDQFPEVNGNTIYLHGQKVSLEQARAIAPFRLQVPTWVPAGFVMDKDVQITKDEDVSGTRIFVVPTPVTIIWRRDKGFPIALTQERASGSGPIRVGPGSVKEVQVNGEPAALVQGVWNAQTQTWIQSSQTLLWRRDGVDYRLGGPLDISADDLVRMAESLK